jgi:hypothetical protein
VLNSDSLRATFLLFLLYFLRSREIVWLLTGQRMIFYHSLPTRDIFGYGLMDCTETHDIYLLAIILCSKGFTISIYLGSHSRWYPCSRRYNPNSTHTNRERLAFKVVISSDYAQVYMMCERTKKETCKEAKTL